MNYKLSGGHPIGDCHDDINKLLVKFCCSVVRYGIVNIRTNGNNTFRIYLNVAALKIK